MSKVFQSAGSSRAPSANGCAATKSRASAAASRTVTVPRIAALPFVTRTTTPRGRILGFCDFDVPAQTYAEGYATGARACAALFDFLSKHAAYPDLVAGSLLPSVLREVGNASQESSLEPSRYGAAAGFLNALDAAVVFAACGSPASGVMAAVIAQHVAQAERAAQRERAESVATMQRRPRRGPSVTLVAAQPGAAQ